MTKRSALSAFGAVIGAVLLTTAFQNCGGGGDLPSNVDSSSVAPLASPSPLTLVLPSPASVTGGGSLDVGATGGTLPYTYSIVSGPGQIDASTGHFTTVAADTGTTVVRVTDKAGGTNENTIAVNVNASTLVTPGTTVFNVAAAAQTFTVPNHNQMTIEVWGGGGGGGGLGYIVSDGGTDGGAGGMSRVSGTGLTAAIVAGGGMGGTHGRVRSFNGSPGAGGAATGGSDANGSGQGGQGQRGGNAAGGGGAGGTNAPGGAAAHTQGQPGGVPGGGGGSTSYNDGSDFAASGGGGGGAYAKSVIMSGTLAPASTLSVMVGAGGAKGNGGFAAPGGAGRVIIKWQ